MKILDLFAGAGGELRRPIIESLGHEYVTVDIESKFNCTFNADILEVRTLPHYDFIWASPPCEGFSVARLGANWTAPGIPKSEKSFLGIRLVKHTLELIRTSHPGAWLLENPRGMLRTVPFMNAYPRRTVTFCQYGETRMKPTDLWGIVPGWTPRPPCKNGDPCHEAAPRGAKTGTQGISGAANRAIVPVRLWIEIINSLSGCIDTRFNNPQLTFIEALS